MNKIAAIKHKYSYSLILLKEMVKTDFKLRYQNSVLGYLWSLLRPLAFFLVLYVVFVKFLGIGDSVPHFAVYLFVGILLWNFFVELTTGNVSAIIEKGDLIRKVKFPKYVIIIANSLSALINLAFNMAVLAVFIILLGASPSWSAIILLPLLLIQIYILGIGVAFLLAALNVKYRDIGFIWDVIMQMGFYATPILYPLTNPPVPEYIQKILILNPMAQTIQGARDVLVTSQTVTITDLYKGSIVVLFPVVLTFVLFVIGARYFKSESSKFAEEL